MFNVKDIIGDAVAITESEVDRLKHKEICERLYSNNILITDDACDGALWDSVYAFLYERG